MNQTTHENDAAYAQRTSLWISLLSRPLVVVLEGLPPTVNHIWKHSGRRVYKSYEATSWDRLAQREVCKAADETYGTHDLSAFKGKPMSLSIYCCRPSWRVKAGKNKGNVVRPDISNLIKVAEDAVTRALGLEDSAVVMLSVQKEEAKTVKTEIVLHFIGEV